MTEFIHYLPNPAAITTLNFEFLDVNDAMLADIKADSKMDALAFLTENFLTNVGCKAIHLNELETSGKICNEKMMLKSFDNSYDLRNVNLTLMHGECKYIFIETFGTFKNQVFFIEKVSNLIKELGKLDTSLNKNGKHLLDKLIKEETEKLKLYIRDRKVRNINEGFKKQLSILSENDMKVCIQIISGFSAQEIAILNETTLNNTRVMLHRICRKLNIESRIELKNYLAKIMTY